MEPDTVCFPAPLGCFKMPAGQPLSVADTTGEEDFADEFILSDECLSASLRAKDPESCFLCIAETIGDED